MGRILELLLVGGAVGGAVYYFTRPSKAATPQLPPPGPPPPNPNEERIKNLSAQVSAETQKQEALQAQVKSMSAAAAAAPAAQKQQLEAAKAKVVLAATQAADKQKALKNELAERAQAEQAAKKAAEAKAAAGPMYPKDLDVRFGKRKAVITEAHQDGQGNWHYTAKVDSGELWGIGSGTYQFSEADMRQKIQAEVGPLQPGQFAVAGVTVYRHGQGGYIQKAEKNAAGEWQYTIQGWPNAVAQSELQGILVRA